MGVRQKAMDKNTLFESAVERFYQRRYTEAREMFIALLRLDPFDGKGQMGVLLCDLLDENEDEAIALMHYYEFLLSSDSHAEDIVMQMIGEHDSAYNQFYAVDLEQASQKLDEGIAYSDFKHLISQRGGDFERTYEDVMLSTRVFVSDSDELFDLIDLLLQNGQKERAYTYLEDALQLYPTDKRLEELFEKLKR
jgi:tetratricopeptide (TPR) repeat protein